jgi:hypothetical protein
MFFAFHEHIKVSEQRRTCPCNACTSAIDLTLKFITHYGEFAVYRIKNFYTLIGKDVIVAHQLLKNTIDKHEYWLITNNLSGGSSPQKFTPWIKWDKGTKQVNKDEISFHFAQLSHLKIK